MPICQMFCAIWSTIFYFLHVLIHVAQQNLVFACKLDNICPQITKIFTQKSRPCTKQGRLGMHNETYFLAITFLTLATISSAVSL